MTAVNFVSATTAVLNGTGSGFTVTLPSGILDGDGLYLTILSDVDLIAFPGDWTQIAAVSPQWSGGVSTEQAFLLRKTTVQAADSGTTTVSFAITSGGKFTVVLWHLRSSTGALTHVTPTISYVENTDYTIAVPTQAATVDGEMWLVGALSKLFTTAPVSYPAVTLDLDPTNAANGHQLVGHVAKNTGDSSSSLAPFVMQSGTSGSNTLMAFIMRITPVGSDPVPIDADVSDTFRAVDLLTNAGRVRLALSDGLGMADVTNNLLAKIIQETLTIAEVLRPNEKFGVVSTETIQIASRLLTGRNLVLTDGIGINEIAQALYAARMVETLGLQSLLAPRMSYGMSITDRIRMLDALRRFFAADVAEGLGLAEALAEKIVLNGRLIDAVGIAPDLTQHVLMRMTVADEIVLDDVELLKMIFAGRLTDGVQISALHVEPNGSITTWAINTKSGTVTEYGNYAFNSFAAMGGRYLGASDTGLYALDGDDDSGTPIIAHLKGGFMQFGNMHLSSIKGVYLGIRGAGDFVLKIETGDKKVFVYGLTARDFETTRVRPGKGLRARFFRFELISTGQDFDLEAIEFIPVVAQRRG